MPDADLIAEIVKAAREKWPEAWCVDVVPTAAQWVANNEIMGVSATVEVWTTTDHAHKFYAPDLPALLAKLKETC